MTHTYEISDISKDNKEQKTPNMHTMYVFKSFIHLFSLLHFILNAFATRCGKNPRTPQFQGKILRPPFESGTPGTFPFDGP